MSNLSVLFRGRTRMLLPIMFPRSVQAPGFAQHFSGGTVEQRNGNVPERVPAESAPPEMLNVADARIPPNDGMKPQWRVMVVMHAQRLRQTYSRNEVLVARSRCRAHASGNRGSATHDTVEARSRRKEAHAQQHQRSGR